MSIIPTYQTGQAAKLELLELKTLEELEKQRKETTDKCILLLFWADWDQPSHQLRDILSELAKTQSATTYQHIKLFWCNADNAREIVDKIDITQVPSLALYHQFKVNPEIIENPSPEVLNSTIDDQNEFYQKQLELEKKKAFLEIETMVKSWPFFGFIKGTPEQPKCKFTRRLVELFGKNGYKYKTFDILSDERIRQWLKFYSKWPTFPQIFVDGKFVGGVDIVCEMIEGGEFDEMLPNICKKKTPEEEVQECLKENKVVALIQGSIDQPENEQSIKLINLLRQHKVKFAAIDLNVKQEYLPILTKLSGLEHFQFPSLFVGGQYLGDLEQVANLESQNKLSTHIPHDCIQETIQSRLEKIINSSKVILFMKGSPDAPNCGFSKRIVAILQQYDGIKFGHFDILTDNEVREALKVYSNWPTYPQLYAKGKLVGGIDIVQELHESNELEEALA